MKGAPPSALRGWYAVLAWLCLPAAWAASSDASRAVACHADGASRDMREYVRRETPAHIVKAAEDPDALATWCRRVRGDARAEVCLSGPVGDGASGLRYRLSRDDIFDLEADVPYSAGPPVVEADIRSPIIRRETEQGALTSSTVGYTYEYDSRITGLDPTRGLLFRFGQDVGGLGGDTKFLTTTVFAMAEQKVWNEEVTLRAIFEGGHIHDLGDTGTRVTDRFFLRSKMRGFEPNGIGPRDGTDDEDALGGNVFAVARFESEFPLGLPEEYGIMGGAFVDVGSVWSLSDTAGLNGAVDDGFKPRVAVGVSVLWDTPVGPLRFNFSKAVKKEDYDREQTFDLTVSTKF